MTSLEELELGYLDDDSFDSEEFSDGKEDEEMDCNIHGNDTGEVKYLTGTEDQLFSSPAPTGPTRAIRNVGRDLNARSTFICLNQDLFKNQIEKEKEKMSNISPVPNVPSRAPRRSNHNRTTFICLNENAFEEKLQIEAEKQKVSAPVPTRPARPPRRNKQESNINFPRFGSAPPARRMSGGIAPIKETKKAMPPAYRELIKTEKDYIANLGIIKNVFLKEIREEQLLSTYETVCLFANIEDLIPINESLLEDLLLLETDTTLTVGTVFQSHAKKFLIYGDYCSNQPNIHELLQQYKVDNPGFSNFLKKCYKKEECRRQDLESFLALPLQRLCRYPLLLKEIVSYRKGEVKQTGPADSGEHGICIWGGGAPDITRIDTEQHWTSISCGGFHFAAVSLGNSVYVWGKGKEGQLGLGESILERDTPTLVSLYDEKNQPIRAMRVICGPLQSAVITENRELYVWGCLPRGRTYLPSAMLFEGKKRCVRSIHFSIACFFVILESEEDPSETEVWVHGKSKVGQLGLGEITSVDAPTQIMYLKGKNIIQLSCGDSHVACLSTHGAVFVWGANKEDCLGLGQTDTTVPQLYIPLLGKTIVQLECGVDQTFARSATGSVYSWGRSSHGSLGQGKTAHIGRLELLSSLENKQIESIVVGDNYGMAVGGDGKAYSWGEGVKYKTCRSTEDDILSPSLIMNLSSYFIKEIACGSISAAAYYQKCSTTQNSIVHLDIGIEEFRQVIIQINDKVRTVENTIGLLLVTNRIENGQRLNIVSPTRRNVLEGSMNVNGKSRFGFLFSDLLIVCRLPTKGDPEKLYKAHKRVELTKGSCVASLPSSDEGKYRLELQIGKDLYIIKLRKKDRKVSWLTAFTENCGLQLSEPITKPSQPLSNVERRKSSSKPASGLAKRKSVRPATVDPPPADNNDEIERVTQLYLLKLKKELQEETNVRTMTEEHNLVMAALIKDQERALLDSGTDENSLKEMGERLESLSTRVDKLKEENIILTNLVKSKKSNLIFLRKANGKDIDDLLNDLDDDSDSEG